MFIWNLLKCFQVVFGIENEILLKFVHVNALQPIFKRNLLVLKCFSFLLTALTSTPPPENFDRCRSTYFRRKKSG